MKKQKDPLEEMRNANIGKEAEIRKAIKEALNAEFRKCRRNK